ncbi:hypothetical protein NDU88_008279 [Pleurodeles waltl]|uniref:Uncharacterized protein n=1 Tax=Pleurodeles waltl TaxID=8319 RepID=A0AAV7VSQ5_PLEWA|nr:hypothetical protein NDU88_008279 [Pleurodeles waltl]
MCAPQNPEERRKAAGAAQWWRDAVELRRTRRGAARILLRGTAAVVRLPGEAGKARSSNSERSWSGRGDGGTLELASRKDLARQ